MSKSKDEQHRLDIFSSSFLSSKLIFVAGFYISLCCGYKGKGGGGGGRQKERKNKGVDVM